METNKDAEMLVVTPEELAKLGLTQQLKLITDEPQSICRRSKGASPNKKPVTIDSEGLSKVISKKLETLSGPTINAQMTDLTEKPTPKKRGRKKKVAPETSTPIQQEAPPEDSCIGKTGRLRKSINYFDMLNQDCEQFSGSKRRKSKDVDDEDVKSPPAKRKGRPRKLKGDLIKSDQLTTDSPNISTSSNLDEANGAEFVVLNGQVNCGICLKSLPEEEWSQHNFDEHYNLGWRIGEAKYILKKNKSTRDLLKQVIEKKKELICNTCPCKFTAPDDYITHKLSCAQPSEAKDNYTCAVCNLEMDKSKWANHKYKSHANLAWKLGETPLDLDNKNVVVSILSQLYKAKKPIYCGQCGITKKSVVGFLSHQTMCKKSDEEMESVRVTCEICQKKVLPVSMSTHMKFVHGDKKEKEETLVKEERLNETLGKRKAHTQALNMIDSLKSDVSLAHKHYTYKLDLKAHFLRLLLDEELINDGVARCKFPNCGQEFSVAEENLEHMKSCDKNNNSYFVCKYCLHMDLVELEMRHHINKIHLINCRGNLLLDNDFDADKALAEEQEAKKENQKRRESKPSHASRPMIRPNFISSKFRSRYQSDYSLFPKSFEWTYEFCENNFNQVSLFPDFLPKKSDWCLLEDLLIDSYLPQMNYSCDLAICNETGMAAFKNYELFESELHESGHVSVFAGGPVTAMVWLPTPYNDLGAKQFLAVAVLNDPNKQYYHNVNYKERGVIQFWGFGPLRNKQNKMENAKLAFCIGHDFGPVWDLAWCPSGCYNDSRLGLLAAAASDGLVYIYSIPQFADDENGLLYRTKPCLMLQLGNQCNQNLGRSPFYATKLFWSKTAGHSDIAVGYSNGAVALFDPNTRSSLLKNGRYLMPYKTFQAHYHYVTGVQILPFGGNNKYLVTSSFDRYVHVWNIQSLKPMVTAKRRFIVMDMIWMLNWFGYICGFDESTTPGPQALFSTITQIRDCGSDWANLMSCGSTVKSLTCSDWLNCISQSTSAGELFGYIPHQLISGLDNIKSKQNKENKFIFARTQLVPKADPEAPQKKPLLYEEAVQCYKVEVRDFDMNKTPAQFKSVQRKCADRIDGADTELYPLTSINKVVFNPNLQASTFVASGYQIGLVRLQQLKFLNSDEQVK